MISNERDGQGTLELLWLLPCLGAHSHLASAFLATSLPDHKGTSLPQRSYPPGAPLTPQRAAFTAVCVEQVTTFPE